ncbi:hypothetical protein EVC45_43990, partial [Paraburkholderia sp. UYCP14C]|uniref:Tn3 family transposase n=1 Tax=Paraburkholderia sp. UYCP14C TaxID=2511130 RepID=UPI001021434E
TISALSRRLHQLVHVTQKSRILNHAKWDLVDAEVLKALSPYRMVHINRFGDYLLDLMKKILPLDPTIDFAFRSAA